MNKFITSGRVANDVEIRQSTNGKTIAKFTFAVRKNFKKDNEPDADFFNCVVFGKLAEVFDRNVRKGTKLLLEGELRNDNYEKDGVKHYGMQYVVNSMEFCESKVADGNNSTPAQTDSTGFPDASDDIDDDLPF